MPIVREVRGDLLTASEKFVAQQCNCVTVRSDGLSAEISRRFPWADPYSTRASISPNTAALRARDVPGTVRTLSSPEGPFKVLCLFAQWAPGKPGAYAKYYKKTYDDTAENRLGWFEECLKRLDEDEEVDSPVAVPHEIGCGLAGGDWKRYSEALENAKTEFIVYRLDRKRKRDPEKK